MKLMFLGSGSAFTVGADNFQSNMLLFSDSGKKLLIDCGTDIRWSLYQAGYSHLDLTDIYLSHVHADHSGGLEYVGFSTKFDPRCSKPKLYLSTELADWLWERSLSGSMRSIQGEITDLGTFFDVQKVLPNSFFTWEGIIFYLIPSVHLVDPEGDVTSYGLFFEVKGTKVYLTTDSQFCPEKQGQVYERADLIFADCETTPFKSGVHAHYQDLVTLPEEIRQKMWLYHYQPGPLPDAQKDGFHGFVKCGQVFEF